MLLTSQLSPEDHLTCSQKKCIVKWWKKKKQEKRAHLSFCETATPLLFLSCTHFRQGGGQRSRGQPQQQQAEAESLAQRHFSTARWLNHYGISIWNRNRIFEGIHSKLSMKPTSRIMSGKLFTHQCPHQLWDTFFFFTIRFKGFSSFWANRMELAVIALGKKQMLWRYAAGKIILQS